MNASIHSIELNLHQLPAQVENIYLAFSGGVDSCVLLHALLPFKNQYRITLWHINHGLQCNAQDMQDLAKSLALRYKIDVKLDLIDLDKNSGNLEARARRQRYDLFAQGLTAKDVLFTAHHMNDQAETLLLNLMRGSGPAGLRAIALENKLGGGYIYRPLLNTSRQQIENYAAFHQLEWVEDESNQDTKFDRNFLRQQVIPLLAQRWPALIQQLHRVSTLQAETELLLNDLAKLDFKWAVGLNQFSVLPVLNVSLMRELSEVRQRNLIRYWISFCDQIPLGFNKIHELIRQLHNNRQNNLIITGQGFDIRFYQTYLYLVTKQTVSLLCSYPLGDDPLQIPEIAFRETRHSVLEYIKQHDNGQKISIHFRTQNAPQTHRHKLKRLFQKYHVPVWSRATCPQIHVNGELVDLLLR